MVGTLARALAAEGMGVLIVEHTMDFLLPLADQVVCLDSGRVVAAGRPDAVLADARAIEAYFGSASP